MSRRYEAVIGLEVHAELKTATKIFCACSTRFGSPPNTQVCPVCLGLPGALPTLNRRVAELGVMAGLALECEISRLSRTDRKHYFYPDLPKGYQISQADTPLCQNGGLTISLSDGTQKRIRIRRIHIEEDAGKLTHTAEGTLVDCNRCGVPLIEIVSAPDLRSSAEAVAYLRELRAILLACGISDCRMEEGSLRCDINVSVREAGSAELGVRTEIKNVNSFSFAEKAIDFEVARQCALLESGEGVTCETRRYDEASGKTVRMRVKETADDYRYLREPDLLPIFVDDESLARLGRALPELPAARRARLARTYGLSSAEAAILVSDGALADYFESAARGTPYHRTLINLLLSELLRIAGSEPFTSPVSASRFAELATLLGEKTVNSATAKRLLTRLCGSDASPREIVEKEGLAQICDPATLCLWIDEAMEELPQAVRDWQNGKKAALRALQGKVMAKSRGLAEPVLCERLLVERLEQK